MNSEQKPEESSPVKEEVIASPEESVSKESTPKKRLKKRRSGFIWFLLLLIITPMVFVQFAPENLKSEYMAQLGGWLLPVRQDAETLSKPIVLTTPDRAEQSETLPEDAVIESEPQPTLQTDIAMEESSAIVPVTIDQESTPINSEEVQQMLDSIGSLQEELQSLHQRQRELVGAQHAIQTMQLRARLSAIINPVNRLPQLRFAWEEIALMPAISSDERKQAQAMLQLTEKRLLDIQNWQQQLQNHAESLVITERASIIPQFENRWLNWIGRQFSIRPSLSKEAADDAALRKALMTASRNIGFEQWPEIKAWLKLRATLQLMLIASKEDRESIAASDSGIDSSVDLGLPESFDTIKRDIDTLRQSAAAWLERLS